jgi:YD repeat-containing protein
MKKQLSLLFFIVLFLQSDIMRSQFLPFYDNKMTNNALQLIGLKGKVKSLVQISYKAVDNAGVITKGEEGVGGLSAGTIYNTNPTVNSAYKMQFDSTGRALEEIYFHGKIIDVTLKHKFNDALKTEEISEYETPGKISCKYTYKYNDKGNKIEEKITNIFYDGKTFDQKLTYKYNALFQLTEVDRFTFKDGKYINDGIGNYTCDSKGNVLTESYLKDKTPCIEVGYKYDDKGNVLEHNYFASCGKTIDHQLVYKYDSHNNVIQKDYFQGGKLKTSFTYRYEYDKTGNWIKRTDLEDGKATFVLERVLTYY